MNVAKLHAELEAAGVPVAGCDATGFIFFRPEATDAHHMIAAQVVAAHDPSPSYIELRAKEYPATDALIVALWERIIEGRPEASDVLQRQREAVKARHPKP